MGRAGSRKGSSGGMIDMAAHLARIHPAAAEYAPAVLPKSLTPLASEYANSSDFSLNGLCKHMAADGEAVHVKRSPNRYFMYTDTEAGHLLHHQTRADEGLVEMSPAELAAALNSPGPYHYFTSPLRRCAPSLAASVTLV